MALVTELELPAFDYTDASMRGDRFHSQAMRERARASRGWLAQGPFGCIVLDRESAEFFLRSRAAIFPGMKIAEIFEVTSGPLYEQMRRNILHVNGPDHSRLRSLVNPALSPRAVERYRPAMREFLAELLGEVRAGAGGADGETVRCEFVEAFAKPYPSLVIASVMGAPLHDAPRLHHWSNWIQRQFDAISMASEREQIEQAVGEFYEYAEELVRVRRESPGDDLISKLIAAEEEGERLSDVECINLVFNILVGGVDTSQSQLAHAVRLLAEHPEQWQLLASDPALAEQAVEEALRYEPITPFTARILTEDVVFRDVTFPRGDDRDGLRVHRQPRPRRRAGRLGRSLRHHRRARSRPSADVRRRRALLPGRQPRARRAAGGHSRSSRSTCTASSSTASPCSTASPASTGSPSCPSALPLSRPQRLARLSANPADME